MTIARTPIIGIAGWKKSGKTTLSVRLIEELTLRGYRVASVKHAHHEFQVDDAETDSARHRRAGAAQTAVVGGKRWALITELKGEPEPAFEDIVASLGPADIILVEGYKNAPIPKIEARRTAQLSQRPLAESDPRVIAIAADHAIEDAGGLPVFSLDDVREIANFIEVRIGPLQRTATAASAHARDSNL